MFFKFEMLCVLDKLEKKCLGMIFSLIIFYNYLTRFNHLNMPYPVNKVYRRLLLASL